MHRFRSWLLDPPEYRTQRNRLLPIEGGDGSTLNLDFTTGLLDPRLSFSRTSNATFINSSRLVQYAASNQQIYSQDQSQSGTWVRQELNGVDANVVATVDPQGGNTASKLRSAATLQAHLIYSTISTSISSGLAYTFSVYVKKAELKYVALHLASTARYTVVFDLDTGLMTTTNSTGTPLGTAYSSQNAGNGWWRLSVTMITQTTTIYPHICLSNSATPAVNASGQPYYTGVLNDGVYTWGAQLNAGSTPLQYIATTTAQKFDQPRFDHDPTTGSLKGLLIEGQSVNLINNSNNIYTGSWGGSVGVTATQDTTIPDPSGGTTTCKIVKAASYQYVVRNQPIPTLTVPANSTVHLTISVWLRMDGANQVAASLGIYDSAGASFGTRSGASVSNSAVTISSGSSADAEFTFGAVTGWVRCSISRSFTNATGSSITFPSLGFYIYPNRVNTNAATIYAWGAQAETGIGPSSLIPTGTGQGTRNQDVCYIPDGDHSWFTSKNNCVLFMQCEIPRTSNFGNLMYLGQWSGGEYSYGHQVYSFAANTVSIQTKINAATNTDQSLFSNQPVPINLKIAMCPNSDAARLARAWNGTVSETTGLTPTASRFPAWTQQARFGIGTNAVSLGSSTACNIYVRTVKFFPFAMSNAQLQSLTTP